MVEKTFTNNSATHTKNTEKFLTGFDQFIWSSSEQIEINKGRLRVYTENYRVVGREERKPGGKEGGKE